MRRHPHRRASRQHIAVALSIVVLAFLASACGSRLDGSQAALARGSAGGNGQAVGAAGDTTTTVADASSTTCGSTPASTSTTTTTAKPGSKATTTTSKATTTTASTTTTTTAPCNSGSGGSGAVLASGGTPGSAGHAATGPSTAAATGGAAAAAGAGTSAAAPCGANGNLTPAGGNGGATATGVTASTIEVANIASISGVAPGLTQSAQQATEAWAAYVNSTGGICGRQVKVQPFDDGNDSGTNYADAQQACSADFAMVGDASGFDDGSAQAVGACGIPDMAAEVSTAAAGNTADIFGASPGNAHYWSLGPANYLKATYPNAVTKAAMIYLNVSATQTQAANETAAYTSDGFHYVYNTSTTPTNANYAANVQAMQSAARST